MNVLASIRNNFGIALRLTAAPMVPLLGGQLLGHPTAGMTLALGGLYVALADVGGPYRVKLREMTIATAGVSLAGYLGTLTGSDLHLALPVMFLWALWCALSGIFGNGPSTVGLIILIAMCVAQGLPGDRDLALLRAVYFAAGGLWAVLLSLLLWPLRPYYPVQAAVALCFARVAEFVRSGASPAARTAFSAALDQAREAVANSRARRQGMSEQGQRLLSLTNAADRLYADSIALLEGVSLASGHSQYSLVRREFLEVLEAIAEALDAIGAVIERGGGEVSLQAIDDRVAALIARIDGIRSETLDFSDDLAALLDLRHAQRALEAVAQRLHAAAATVRSLPRARSGRTGLQPVPDSLPSTDVWEKLRDNLSLNSLVLRHALRLAVALTISTWIYHGLHLPRGFWVTLTVAIILKPDFGGTRQRAIERTIGTILGGILAAILVGTIVHPIAISVALIPIGFVAWAIKDGSYQRFVIFLTIYVVLLLNVGHPGDWQIALVRMLDTALGGALALIAGYTLWPQWARADLPAQLARTVAADRAYFERVACAYLSTRSGSIREARQEAQRENTNAAVALQRMLSEPRHVQRHNEPFYTLTSYSQRFCDAVTALATYLPQFSGRDEIAGMREFMVRLDGILTDMEEALRDGRPPQAALNLDDAVEEANARLGELRATRVAEIESRPDTPNRDRLRDTSVAAPLLSRLADDVAGMFHALVRLTAS